MNKITLLAGVGILTVLGLGYMVSTIDSSESAARLTEGEDTVQSGKVTEELVSLHVSEWLEREQCGLSHNNKRDCLIWSTVDRDMRGHSFVDLNLSELEEQPVSDAYKVYFTLTTVDETGNEQTIDAATLYEKKNGVWVSRFNEVE